MPQVCNYRELPQIAKEVLSSMIRRHVLILRWQLVLTVLQLCGEKEVLAQVKLSFKATSGAKMVATRSLQLTVKKAIRQFKTLEGQLLMVKDGERTAISSRVAELDQIMPQYLGVSKAVLDSVIFCHQDESMAHERACGTEEEV
jgi:hypothetical protein